MTHYAYRWFTNIVALLEKRSYHTYNVLLFALFVAAVRLFAEWAVGGAHPGQLFPAFLVSAGFYWLSFFAVTAVLAVLVEQPWRRSINVILVGVFLGIFPPLIDVAVSGRGFEYGYVWYFPAQWRWAIYNPEHKITAGEGTVLWAVVLLTTLYVRHKTKSLARTAAAFVLAYGSVVLILALVATAAEATGNAFGWPIDHRVSTTTLYQFFTALAIYAVLQRRSTAALASRAPEFAVGAGCFLFGAALHGPFAETIFVYGAILFVLLAAAFVRAGEAEPFDEDDVRFYGVTAAFVWLTAASAHAPVAVPLLIAGIALFAARAPETRLAAAGLGSLAAGIVAGMEQAAFEAPRWWIQIAPRPLREGVIDSFHPAAVGSLVAAALGFAAYAAWRRDPAAPRARLALAAVIALVPVTLALWGRIGWMYPPAGVAAAALFLAAAGRPGVPAAARFAPGAYALCLAFALRFPMVNA